MKYLFILSFAALGVAGRALPGLPKLRRDVSTFTDVDILNYALTLEHLENAFYSGALAAFNQSAFDETELPDSARGRFAQIGQHEKQHVELLSTVLGSNATKPCNYTFPYTDPQSFAALSQVLEGVGVSAYTGAAKFLKTNGYLEVAASILSTEARHASFVAGALNNQSPWSGAFDVPLTLDQVYSLAASFIVSCPADNPPLPVKAFPALNVTSNGLLVAISPGSNIKVSYTPATPAPGGTTLCLAFYTGLDVKFAPLTADHTAVVPANLTGTVYGVVSTNCTKADDTSIIAGPFIFVFDFDENGNYQ
ncbi:ferritin-like domain-containing protein [Mycena metata]|uniref:Ferritin-like domain-containing protein n=1 Tax=Mycena metata TaxID=1033252 RepID=A0AAD7JTA5_9AGAR|nr:ferritin-like domain-containing protein [Mycena metata]